MKYVACQQKNKIPVLRGPKKKKVKTPTDCYDMCFAKSSCMRWNHKMSKKVAKRLCMLMSVTYAVRNFHGYDKLYELSFV